VSTFTVTVKKRKEREVFSTASKWDACVVFLAECILAFKGGTWTTVTLKWDGKELDSRVRSRFTTAKTCPSYAETVVAGGKR
jgi:hypothetical protein